KTEAITERDRRMAELRTTGIPLPVGEKRLTFDELTARFIEHERGASARLSRRTCDLRKQLLAKHVSPVLGEPKATEITTPHIQALSDKLTANGLSGSSVRGIISSISGVMGYGARYGHVTGNPCREVALPSAKRQTRPRYLSRDDVSKLLDAL